MRTQGRIVTWNDEKGFGFILPVAGGNQAFVHIKGFPRGTIRPTVGAEVTYCSSVDAQGRSRAEKVRIVGVGYSIGCGSFMTKQKVHKNNEITFDPKQGRS